MPPRLHCSNACSSSTLSFLHSPFLRLPVYTAHPSRNFSQTRPQLVTTRRQKFYDWLNGPGRSLKEPLPGSTNYLGAYDRYGNLIRAPGWQRDTQRSQRQRSREEAGEVSRSPEQGTSGQPATAENAEKAEGQEARPGKEGENSNELPPETAEDLRPFPINQYFRSQPVLSEELREAIYQRVQRDGATVSLASVQFGVSNERVGAVVRLKQMEKEWIAQGKLLALPYSKAVLKMLPTTPHIDSSLPANKGKRPAIHEPINDLNVHPATRQQLFVPVAESRRFTRVDAGMAFHNKLLPADDRIPHPELVQTARELESGLSLQERKSLAKSRHDADEQRNRNAEARRQKELQALKVVPQRRWDFVFKDISVEAAGRDGKGAHAEGWRYGVPHQDRKRGIPKIPTKVEA